MTDTKASLGRGENDNSSYYGVKLEESFSSHQAMPLYPSVTEIQSNEFAFAALLEDGSVVSWGAHTHGGDGEDIQDQLKNIQFIAATSMAFCAVTNDGKVATWGRGDESGDSSAIQRHLSSLI